MKNWGDFYDFGHYGIFDEECCFYPEVLERLKADLASGGDFDSGWGGFKKELQSIRIQAVGDKITVSVSAYMDDVEDLIFDCENSDDLTDDDVDLILRLWYENYDATTETSEVDTLPRNSTVIDILKLAVSLARLCDDTLTESFNYMQGTVNDVKELRENMEENS